MARDAWWEAYQKQSDTEQSLISKSSMLASSCSSGSLEQVGY